MHSLMVPWFWAWPKAFDWLLLIASGLAGALGHLCLIRALVSICTRFVIAPFSYSSLIWATLFGFVIWKKLAQFGVDWSRPHHRLWPLIFHRERRHNAVAVET